MASHAGARQAIVAQNMANADTPGYAARDIESFRTLYEGQGGTFLPRATRTGHLFGNGARPGFEPVERKDVRRDPNGNSVALETEMLNAVDVKRQHDRAIAIYRSSLTLLRTALGRG
ncbi:FlgB family protein [Roseovarius tibetensis]|uniref:FlgB family protein n=1 Tax=Roseovarius tibetensis TaxID=2685897 RepID=UPI003D7F1ECA